MRNLYLILFVSIIAIGCQSPEPIQEPPQVRQILTKIMPTGDFVVDAPLPMLVGISSTDRLNSTAVNTDLYGIQIYTKAKSPASATYKSFAYGVFDDISKALIELPDNMLYKVCITFVRNGKSWLSGTDQAYKEPFAIGGRATPADNTFTYSNTTTLSGIFLGKSSVKDESTYGFTLYPRPIGDRYAGELVDFEPREGLSIEVLLKRVVFGIRLSAPGLSEGHVQFDVEGAPSIKILPSQGSLDVVLTLAGSSTTNVWLDDNYTETVICKAKWIKADKTEVQLGPADGKAIVVKRKFLFPVTTRVTWDKLGTMVVMEPEMMTEQPEVVF